MSFDINVFIEFCEKFGDAAINGTTTETNKFVKKIEKQSDMVKKENCYTKLVPLLNHESDFVKLFAATTLIPYNPELAKSVLLELNSHEGVASMYAMGTIDMWKAGFIKAAKEIPFS